jgi:hypothetical protein
MGCEPAKRTQIRHNRGPRVVMLAGGVTSALAAACGPLRPACLAGREWCQGRIAPRLLVERGKHTHGFARICCRNLLARLRGLATHSEHALP